MNRKPRFKHKSNPKDICECGHFRRVHNKEGCTIYVGFGEHMCSCEKFKLQFAFMEAKK